MSKVYYLLFVFLLSSCAQPMYVSPPAPSEIYPPIPRVSDAKVSSPKSDVFIVIDPGHGGDDFGTHSNTKPKYQEKHLNLATAQLLRTFLNKQGYKTVMTRNDDTFITLDRRAEFANEQKPTLFVSVHYNSAPSAEAEGVEVFFYKSDDNKNRTRESRLLAKSILDKVLDNTQAKSRGVKHGNFAVIRQTNMPAVLIEGGFLTNDSEMQRIKDPAYIKKLALGIAQGITAYIERTKN
jgi:N-acetylmuramoyl-L-alanine amidase